MADLFDTNPHELFRDVRAVLQAMRFSLERPHSAAWARRNARAVQELKAALLAVESVRISFAPYRGSELPTLDTAIDLLGEIKALLSNPAFVGLATRMPFRSLPDTRERLGRFDWSKVRTERSHKWEACSLTASKLLLG